MSKERENNTGNRIKRIRLELKLKQQEFAEKLDMSGPSLSEIETGKYKPGFELLAKLYKTFNVSLYYVIFGEGSMFVDPVESSSRRAQVYAKNTEDVREFLYYFERSSILQYFILNQYKKQMMVEKDLILKEVEDFAAKTGE
jgi:transcriptional regulator with XRE-family HTH domain